MHWEGIILAVITFLLIGLFHPIVIKAEYYFGTRCWPIFAIAGAASLVGSVVVSTLILSVILGVLGCSFLWSIHELFQQKKRVEKGWFPKRERPQ